MPKVYRIVVTLADGDVQQYRVADYDLCYDAIARIQALQDYKGRQVENIMELSQYKLLKGIE